MESLKRTLALAAFEARLSRRMIRVWILGIIAVLAGVVLSIQPFTVHRFFSGFNGSWSILSRDLWVLQSVLQVSAAMGLFGVFYVFDWRHRDVSRHFAATLDSSPLTRLEHSWGKFLGFVPALIAPFAVLALVHAITALVSGVSVPLSTFAVAYLGFGIPAVLNTAALAFGLAGLLGRGALGRIAAVIVPLAWLGVAIGVGLALDEKYAVLMGGLVDMPVWSDWVGYTWSGVSIVQRAWVIAVIALFVSLASLGPLGLAQDGGERRRRAAVVGVLAVLAAGCSALAYRLYVAESASARAVVDAEARAHALPRPTVTRRDVAIDLSKRGRLAATAEIGLRNDTGAPLTSVALRLNSGLRVTGANVDGAATTTSRDATVVTVPLPGLAPGAAAVVSLSYEGGLDTTSADPLTLLQTREAKAIDRNNRRVLGMVPAYLTRGVAVLPADSGFYPDPAMISGAKYPQRAYPDLAPSRVSVTLPGGWSAAATGVREGEGTSLTFVADEPQSGIGLCAGAYREARMEAGGTTFRMLYHPKHERNIAFFAEAKDVIAAALAERISDLQARAGLRAPKELTLVDVPQQLATYCGSWDAPNRLGQPGLVLAKEGALFGARFESAFKQEKERAKSGAKPAGPSAASAPSGSTASDFDPAQAKLEILQRFLATDFTGGSVPRLAVRSAWDARVQPTGDGLAILGPVLSSFVAETVLGRFTVDTGECARLINGQAIGEIVQAMIARREQDIPDIAMRALVDPDDAYAYMVDVPVDQMDPAKKPREWAGVLYIKGRRPLLALRDLLGSEPFARTVSSLQAKGRFGWADFREALVSQAPENDRARVGVLIDGWLAGTKLPGFAVEKVETFRLPGADESWQVVATIANKGTLEGLARFSAGTGKDAVPVLVSVPAGARIEAGVVVPRKTDAWKLEPYLALNRTPPAGLTVALESAPADAVAFTGQREAPPSLAAERIIVDNLDEGFTVSDGKQQRAFNERDAKGERVLSAWAGWRAPAKWARWRYSGRWSRPYGAFDETAAIKAGGKGTAPATWRATLSPGQWRVEAWLPKGKNDTGRQPAPAYEFVVKDAAGDHPVTLSLDAGKEGWNDLGRFRFDGDAQIVLLDKGKGLIVADAVRFTKESP